MRQEAVLAVIIGIILGLGVTYGIYQVKNRMSPAENGTLSTELSVSPTPAINEKLLVTSPEDESVVTDTQITISGTAESNQMIVIYVNERNYTTQADEIGAFAVKVPLDLLSNVIEVTAISTDGTQEKKSLTIIRENPIEEQADSTETATQSPTPTRRVTP